jgi:hypothetical protein
MDFRIKVLDKVGMGISFLCAIHCMVFPFVLAFIPSFGATVFFGNGFNILAVLISILIAGVSFLKGFEKHRRFYPTLIFSSAVILICVGIFVVPHTYDLPFMIIGGTFIFLAHLLNLKLCDHCQGC